jgi:hypothetical protein
MYDLLCEPKYGAHCNLNMYDLICEREYGADYNLNMIFSVNLNLICSVILI